MKRIKNIICGLLLVSVISVFLAGCNTFEGAGKDIERGGEEIQDIAN